MDSGAGGVWGFARRRERAAVAGAVRAAIAVLRCGRVQVDVAAVEPGEMARLNRRFRGRRGATDVLSFAVPPDGRPGGDALAGEVYLCPSRVAREAGRGRKYLRRLAQLAVHGVLHVLGFHHSDREAEARMFALQRAILRRESALYLVLCTLYFFPGSGA